MKYKETMVAYNHGGPIRTGPWPDRTGWSDDYQSSVGACELRVQEANREGRAIIMLLDFHHAVVRDRVPVAEAHKAFLNIDEYRDMMACDVPGVEEARRLHADDEEDWTL